MPSLRWLLALGIHAVAAAASHGAIANVTVHDNEAGDYLTLVRQDGSLLDAVNLGHTGPPVVVNGIAFESAPGTTPSGANWEATGGATNDGLENPGIDDVFFSELHSPGSTTLTYGNLDPAKSYLLQILHGEPRDCCATTYSNNTLGTDLDRAVTLPPIMIGNGVDGEDPPAATDIAIVTATLSGVTEFTYIARGGPGRASAISAFQVRELGGAPPEPTGDVPFISEIVASGNDSHEDEDGDTPDWIEIYNPTGVDLDLGGYFLTDDPARLDKWRFPAALLPAATFLVVFASDKDRDTAGEELHANFRLASEGEYLALVAPDATTVVSAFAPAYPVQEDGFSYGVGGFAPDGPTGYFANDTPGAPNGILLTAPLLAPAINPPCTSFQTSAEVAITTNLSDVQIRYTTDGSEPTTSSPAYSGPLTISATTHLRARLIDPATGAAGAIASGHFLKLSTSGSAGLRAPATFTSDLPIMVVENFGAGGIPSPGSVMQTARLAVHAVDPVTGRSSLANPPDACFRIGIRRRGQSSSGFPKPQYRVELRDENDVDTDYPLLGLPEESDWVFNGPWTDKALIRNPLAFELGRRVGIEAPRSAHFEMFLSTNGGDLAAAEYVGVYVLLESIKESRNRTDIAELDPTDSVEPAITGGYLFRFEPPGIANDGPRATNWTSVEITEPDAPTTAQRAWLGRHLDQFVRTLGWSRGSGPNNAGRPNPDPLTGYPAYINVESFVSLFIVNELLRDQDAYVRSDYMFKDRLGKIHKGPLWDYNLTAGTGCCFDNRNTQGWQHQHDYNRGGRDHSYEPDWFVPLMRCPDFRQQVIDRWAELRTQGVLEVSNLFDVIDALADPLTESSRRNFAKWNTLGDGSVGFPTPVTDTWQEQIDFMKNWLVQRMGWIDSEFPGLVSLSQPSGVVTAGTEISIDAEVQHIYVTTDGSDPRLPGGERNPDSVLVTAGEPIAIDSTVDLIARSFDGEEWSAPAAATYVVGTPADATNLAVTELNYHPPDPTASEVLADPTYRDDDFEFIEFQNIASEPIDLSGIRFIDGISFTVPAPTVLQPGAYALLVENLAAFEERYGSGLPVVGVYANKLDNDGETLRVLDVAGNDLHHFTFNDAWYRPTDGDGYTLVPVEEGASGVDLSDPASWGISCDPLGSPGAPNGSAFTQTFAGWMHHAFTPAELSDPLVSGYDADFDFDGIVTLLEFALGLNPKSADPFGLPVSTRLDDGGSEYLALAFRRWKKSLGIAYRVETSGDLVTWVETTAQVGPPTDNGDGTETVVIRDTVPIDDAGPRRFIRLLVTLE